MQSGEYKCQVTMDTPPFQFIQAAAYLSIMVLPERHPVISGEPAAALGLPLLLQCLDPFVIQHNITVSMSPGLKQTIYLPGDKVSINCTSSPSWPAAKLSWQLNSRPVDRWMVTSYLPSATPTGLESSTLALNFLVLPEHFRSGGGAGAGEDRELWATCKSDMPRIQGMEIPMERTLLLGSLAGRYITQLTHKQEHHDHITECQVAVSPRRLGSS